jgi:HEAT repeat protein
MRSFFFILLLMTTAAAAISPEATISPEAAISSEARSLQPEDRADDLIAEFARLSADAVEEKIALLDRIAACDDRSATAFISRTMEKDPRDEVRGHAFVLWADGKHTALVTEFLDSRRRSSRFGAYVAAIPELSGFEGFEYLSAIYGDESLERIRPAIFAALAALDDERALPFLETEWMLEKDPRRSCNLLEILLDMPQGRSTEFLERLLASEIPEARLSGAERMLQKEAALLPRVEVFLQRETHPGVRAELVRQLGEMQSPRAAAVLIRTSEWHAAGRLHEIVEALSGMPPEAVRNAVSEKWYEEIDTRGFCVTALALSNHKDSGFERRLRAAEKKGTPAVRIVAAVARGRQVDNRDRIKRFFSSGTFDARWEMLETVRSYGIRDAAVVKRLLDMLAGSRQVETQIKAAEILGSLGLSEALPALEKALGGKRLLVRVASAKALKDIRDKESVRILVERLPREEGRVAWEIARSLESLTQRSHGADAARWAQWWEANAESFAVLPIQAELKRPLLPEGASKGRYSFYGLPIDSHNIVFVLDVSGSMAGFMGGNAGEAPITRLIRELSRTIQSLTPAHRINMVFFDSRVRKWRSGLVPMKDEAGGYKQEALVFVRYLRAEGGTNLYGGMMAAMDDEEVDAIVLLSDGEPTEGKYIVPDVILDRVLARNRALQVSIHTIALGEEADRVFLRRLALATGGTYKER